MRVSAPSPSGRVREVRTNAAAGAARAQAATAAPKPASRRSTWSSTTSRRPRPANTRPRWSTGSRRSGPTPSPAPIAAHASSIVRASASSNRHAPPYKRGCIRAASSVTTRDFPTPPGPVTSITPGAGRSTRASSAESSASRPTNPSRGARTFPCTIRRVVPAWTGGGGGAGPPVTRSPRLPEPADLDRSAPRSSAVARAEAGRSSGSVARSAVSTRESPGTRASTASKKPGAGRAGATAPRAISPAPARAPPSTARRAPRPTAWTRRWGGRAGRRPAPRGGAPAGRTRRGHRARA